MNATQVTVPNRLTAAELREAFDRAFTLAVTSRATELDDFLSIRMGERPFAFQLTELTRIEAMGKLVALPGAHPWLLGLTSSLGRLLPVFSMELALGFGRTSGEKWLALVNQEEPLGLAFDSLDGYLRIPKADIISMGNVPGEQAHEHRTIKAGEELRSVINLHFLLSVIRNEIGSRLTS